MNKKMASIYCDGACSGNGTRSAFGGWAWAYWPGQAAGEPLHYGAQKLLSTPDQKPTNQRAELTALLEALRWLQQNGESATIYTDSMYAINCTTKWGPGWKRKGWKRDSGEPLLNLDIIKPLVEIWKPMWPLKHVRGHQTGSSPEAHGNNWVDRAAVAAAHGSPVSKSLFLDIPSSPSLSISPSHSFDKIEHVFAAAAAAAAKPQKKPSAPVKQSDIRQWFS